MSKQNINTAVITGNLTQDPELRHTGGGTPVCRLRVAVNGRRKDGQSGEWVDKPNYFNVTVWGAHGEACHRNLSKGSPVAVEGRLDWREWVGDDDKKREAVEIVARSVEFGPKRPASPAGGSGNSETTAENNGQQEIAAAAEAPPEADGPSAEKPEEDEIPF